MPEVLIFEQRQPGEVTTVADPTWVARSAEASRIHLIDQVLKTKVDDTLKTVYKTSIDKKTEKSCKDGPSARILKKRFTRS